MLHPRSNFSDGRISAPARTAAIRRERPLDQTIKVRRQWPFTVNGVYNVLSSEEHRPCRSVDASTFVT
ncbi:MAG: hypothetical protein JWR68_632 [Polaromonas sp.]|nr:hypothetical protein [Polaromonas sp.]